MKTGRPLLGCSIDDDTSIRLHVVVTLTTALKPPSTPHMRHYRRDPNRLDIAIDPFRIEIAADIRVCDVAEDVDIPRYSQPETADLSCPSQDAMAHDKRNKWSGTLI